MQAIRNIIIGLGLLLLFRGCTYPFTPEVEEIPEMIVISGKINNPDGHPIVEVSMSSSYNDPAYNPVSKCTVFISDDKNNRFSLSEFSPGKYHCWIDLAYLSYGTGYRVEVTTPDGKQYQSDYETLLPCPPIENLYYEVKEKETDNPDNPLYGIQFFLDTDASGSEAKNFMWDLTETWEYHSKYMVGDYYDGTINFSPQTYDTLFYCWKTARIYDIYTFTVNDLTSGKITRCPLNYVSGETDRLSVKYSLLVKQYSISQNAYNYWNAVKDQSQNTGGMYETQPVSIKGNIHCITNPEETVLGYFTVSSCTEKRIFVPRDFDFVIYSPPCQPYDLDAQSLNIFLSSYKPEDYPIFLLNLSGTRQGPWDYAEQTCFDCTKLGGSVTKPDFWE
jgi:Domain of unknown function (DUF4249)